MISNNLERLLNTNLEGLPKANLEEKRSFSTKSEAFRQKAKAFRQKRKAFFTYYENLMRSMRGWKFISKRQNLSKPQALLDGIGTIKFCL